MHANDGYRNQGGVRGVCVASEREGMPTVRGEDTA
jgi:hypothetical protein